MTGRLLLLAATLCLPLAAAHADMMGDEFKLNSNVWKNNDTCARQAFKQFPDYTPEGNAKRAHAMQQCLAASNAPPRASLNPKPAAPAPDQPSR
jgi:hypothetical protein